MAKCVKTAFFTHAAAKNDKPGRNLAKICYLAA